MRRIFRGIRFRVRFIMLAGISNLLLCVKAELTKSTVLLTINRQDCKHPISLRYPASDWGMYYQVFIDQEYDFLAEIDPKVIVDAGANVGFASIYFANKYPDAKIIAIEPEQINFDLLKENTKHYPNVIPVQAALWHKNGSINLVDPGFGECGFMTEDKDIDGATLGDTRHIVEAMNVDKVMEIFNIEKIDIFKIDIEGAEKEVFSDTGSWIERVNSIVIELHDRMKPGCSHSFDNGSKGFDSKWHQGENVCLSRKGYLKEKCL